MTKSNYQIGAEIRAMYADKWYAIGNLVILTRNTWEHKAGEIGRVSFIPAEDGFRERSVIGVQFFNSALDDLNVCSVVSPNPPLLTEYCEPISEDDPRVLVYTNASVARAEQDDARLMIELFDIYFKGVEAYGQILSHYGEKFLDPSRYAILSENLRRAHTVAERDKELFQKACLYFLDAGVSIDGFWEFYNGLGIASTDGNPFYMLGVLLGKIPTPPAEGKAK